MPGITRASAFSELKPPHHFVSRPFGAKVAFVQQKLLRCETRKTRRLANFRPQRAQSARLAPHDLVPLLSRSLIPCFSRQRDVRMKWSRLGNKSALARGCQNTLLQACEPRRHDHVSEEHSGAVKEARLAHLNGNRCPSHLAEPRPKALQLLGSRVSQELQRDVPRLGRAPAQSATARAQPGGQRPQLVCNGSRERDTDKKAHIGLV